MNLVPKEIKDSLVSFKKSLKQITYTTIKFLDLNYSKIFTNNQICVCNNKLNNIDNNICNCPYVPNFDIYLQSSQPQNNINFLLFIKNIDLIFNIETGLFNLVYLNDNQKNIIMKGIIKNYQFAIQNYTIPIKKINLPNKLIFRIYLINDLDEEYESNNILEKGIINFGINIY